jgi:hypothetical protein
MESKFTNWCLSGPEQMYEFLLGLPGLPRLLGFVGLFTFLVEEHFTTLFLPLMRLLHADDAFILITITYLSLSFFLCESVLHHKNFLLLIVDRVGDGDPSKLLCYQGEKCLSSVHLLLFHLPY